MRNKILASGLFFSLFVAMGCTTGSIRLPSSIQEAKVDNEISHQLKLAASKGILIYLPEETLFEANKSEVNFQCRSSETPFWKTTVIDYLTKINQNPMWYKKFHAIEIKKHDEPEILIENDLDGGAILSLRYGKSETVAPINYRSKLPCTANVAEYLGQNIVVTKYIFPDMKRLEHVLSTAEDKKVVPRFNFKTDFLEYLAERGMILKFNYDLSFEKMMNGEYTLVNILNGLATDVKKAPAKSYLNGWVNRLNQFSKKESNVLLFGFENRVQGNNSGLRTLFSKDINSKLSVSYLNMSYKMNADSLEISNLEKFDQCLNGVSYSSLNEISTLSGSRMPANADEALSFSCEH